MNEQLETAQKFLEIETGLSELYETFARSFMKHVDFWEKLSQEEAQHAYMVQTLIDEAKKGRLIFDDPRIHIRILSNMVEDIQEARRRAREGEFDSDKAFRFALNFESTIVEKKAFDNFTGTEEKVVDVLGKLKTYSMRHRERIEEYIKVHLPSA